MVEDGGNITGHLGSSFSPKQFLKRRRPERFSDTVTGEVPVLDRALLEYHLDTLTSRSQELLFESFAKALLEKTVCPNLLTHTGPSGGGDSKVDSETFPVAKSLALSWYVGDPEAASERWAFAFSANKKWRPKLIDDIAKIVQTARGYAKAFFVSSQFIRDKARAEAEDTLKKEHGIEVHIFDRSWILDQIYTNRLENLAISTLGIQVSSATQVRTGPRDTARQQRFEEVEKEIADALQEGRKSSGLADNCLLSADLARSMERPRQEVDGLYRRAERLAEECGTPHQKLLCCYERAWTSYWWYEDYSEFLTFFKEFEGRAAGSENPYELELWSNLFSCFQVCAGGLGLQHHADLEPHAAALLEALDRVAQQEERVSASLRARTLHLQVQLQLAKPEERDPLLIQLTQAIKAAEGLIGFPFEPLAKLVTEFGPLLGHLPAYQDLFEVTVTASAHRAGELSAARMLLLRGEQQITAKKPYEAIRLLGRALGKLYKHESRDEAVHALYLCSCAYEQVDLLWAARGTALAAANVAVNDFWTYESVTPHQAACFRRVKWLELRLGRLGPALAWHEVDRAIRGVLANRGELPDVLAQDEHFDPILGMLLLRSDIWTLRYLAPLPDRLAEVDLQMAGIALLYALGHEEKIPPDLGSAEGNPESLKEFFQKWRDQPAADDLPLQPAVNLSQLVEMKSSVAGCRIEVACKNESPPLEVAESLLACIEALMATAIVDGIVAHEPLLKIKVESSPFADDPFSLEFAEVAGQPLVNLRCRSFSPHRLNLEEQSRIREAMTNALTGLSTELRHSRIGAVADPALPRRPCLSTRFGLHNFVCGSGKRTGTRYQHHT